MVDVTARTTCGWVMFRESGELLHGRRFPLMLTGAVIGVTYGQQYCMEVKQICLRECEMGILQRI